MAVASKKVKQFYDFGRFAVLFYLGKQKGSLRVDAHVKRFVTSLCNLMNQYDSDAKVDITVEIGGVKRGNSHTFSLQEVRKYSPAVIETMMSVLLRGLSDYGPSNFCDWMTGAEKTDEEFIAEEKAFEEKMRKIAAENGKS